MKYTFETDDEQEAQTLLNAFKSKYVIIEIMSKIRNHLKYDNLPDHEYLAVAKVQDMIINIVGENDLPFE